jgi:DNA-binding SARP family transcriptional activator
LSLRLLGPIELVVDRRSLDIGGHRQRVVMAMLALNANRVTPVDQLIDAVWDSSPPSTARGQIQICISGLRKLFADAGQPGAIRTKPPGYVLEIAPGELDSEQFAGLVLVARTHADGGRVSEAATTLRNALALWRGSALAGVHSDLVQRGAALLEERRRAALDERLRLDLALGRHEEITGDLRALVNEHPLHEKLYGLLMLALYRSGRQAEALEVCRKARTILLEEVGLDPGQELQALERAILSRDPELNLPVVGTARIEQRRAGAGATAAPADQPELLVVPRQLPATIADFTGRESKLQEIKQVLAEQPRAPADPYAMRVVAISGKGGVGKSCLAVRVAHEVADAFSDGHLYADMRAPGADDPTATVLARFLRALGVSGAAVPEDLQERVEMYRSRLAGKRVLIVLDDVTSEEQVLPLLPGSPTCAVLTTGRRLPGLPGAHRVHLDVFDEAKSLEMLSKIVGRERMKAEWRASSELVTFCDGLPLALRVAGARLASRPHWRIDGLVARLQDEARRLDELTHHGLELRSNIGVIYRGLSQQAKRLFRLFALIQAPNFPGWTAAALLDTGLYQAEDVLETLVDAQVLDTVEYRGARHLPYRFHDLIRVYAREQLMATESQQEREAALGRVLGAWLGLAEEAHRKCHGGDYTILHGNAPRWRPRGREAVDSIGNPMEWWAGERRTMVAAVRQAAEAGMDELCWDLALTSVTLFEAKGYFDDWRETSEIALEVTRRKGNRNGEAAMLYSLGTLHLFQQRLDEADRCLTDALARFRKVGNVHGCGLVLRNAAFVDGLRGMTAGMLGKYVEALRILREVGDRVGEAHVLRSLAKFEEDGGNVERAQEMLEESLAICQDVRCLRGEAQALYRFAELYLHTDRHGLARQALHRTLRIVRDLGDPIGEAYALCGLGIVRHREGRLDNAVTTLVHALDVARRVGERLVEGQALYQLGEIALARGSRSAAVAHLSEARHLFDQVNSGLWRAKTLVLLSEVHSADGKLELAGHEAAQAAALLAGFESPELVELRAGLERSTSAASDPITPRGVDLA